MKRWHFRPTYDCNLTVLIYVYVDPDVSWFNLARIPNSSFCFILFIEISPSLLSTSMVKVSDELGSMLHCKSMVWNSTGEKAHIYHSKQLYSKRSTRFFVTLRLVFQLIDELNLSASINTEGSNKPNELFTFYLNLSFSLTK